MTPEKQIQQMVDEGKMFKAHHDTAMNIYDAVINGEDMVIFHSVGHDKEMDVSVSVHVGYNATEARNIALGLLAWADKYDPQEKVSTETQEGEDDKKKK